MAKKRRVATDQQVNAAATKKGRRAGRKRKAAADWTPQNMSRKTSSVLRGSLEVMRAECNDPSITCGGEEGRVVIGLRMPFPLEYALQNSVFPLSRVTTIVGPTHCNKSALTFEMLRWLLPYHGIGYVVENETKASPNLAESIIGYADEAPEANMWGIIPSYSIEDWQEKLQKLTNYLRAQMVHKSQDNPNPPGKVYPVFMILDSLMSKLARETQAKIETDGHAGRNWPVESNLIASFLRKFPQDLAQWPFSLIIVNHQRTQKSEFSHTTERKKPGGAFPDFLQTFELELNRAATFNRVDVCEDGGLEVRGNIISMRVRKNGLGTHDLRIKVPIKWFRRRSPATQRLRQYTQWDWDTATTWLLVEQSATAKKRIDDIVDIRPSSKSHMYWSRQLGVSREAAVDEATIGRLISQDAKIVDSLRELLGIELRKEFKSGVSYDKQLDAVVAGIQARIDHE